MQVLPTSNCHHTQLISSLTHPTPCLDCLMPIVLTSSHAVSMICTHHKGSPWVSAACAPESLNVHIWCWLACCHIHC